MNLGSGKNRGGGGAAAGIRMKGDQVKVGIKVLNGEENQNSREENGKRGNLKRGRTIGSVSPVAVSGKRKTEPPPSPPPPTKSLIPVSVSVDGIRKSPVQVKKGGKEISKSVDGIEKSPIKIRRSRSEISNGSGELSKEIVVYHEKANSGVECLTVIENGSNSLPDDDQEKENAESESEKNCNDLNSVPENQERGNAGSESEENCKEFGVCQENVISSTENAVEVEDGDEDEEFDEDEAEEELEDEEEDKFEVDLKEMNVPEQKLKSIVDEFNNKTTPSSSPIYTNPTPKHTQFSASHGHRERYLPKSQNKLQNLVDLVMWRDVSRSTFVFGIGTFIIISSSYTQDINFSFISVISYLGLVYLGAIFLYRSIICRGIVEIEETDCVLGEEEAVWFLELFLPYLNEFLLKLKALFSGDPATTMKLAVLLFFLARCGSYITFWKMAKLGFFAVFTVPKVCSCYSHQLTAYGKFWIKRFRDAWDSCTHKKAVVMGIFTIVWNLSSTAARVWAAFMLFVALRYYQQSLMLVTEEWVEEKENASGKGGEETLLGRNRYQRGPRESGKLNYAEANLPNKLKKGL